MTVGMTDVHLPYLPRLIGRWIRDLDPRCFALVVDRIHVLNPNAKVPFFGSLHSECHREITLAATTLSAFTQENLARTRTDGTERGWRTPIPQWPSRERMIRVAHLGAT